MRRLRAARAGGGDAPHKRAQSGDERGGRPRGPVSVFPETTEATETTVRVRIGVESVSFQALRGRHARGYGGDDAVRAHIRGGGHHHPLEPPR